MPLVLYVTTLCELLARTDNLEKPLQDIFACAPTGAITAEVRKMLGAQNLLSRETYCWKCGRYNLLIPSKGLELIFSIGE